ncbi:MAG: domain containing protein [Acidobacteria bacterium]|nr:domain containing protein [Acidobacteriota bacterium]
MNLLDKMTRLEKRLQQLSRRDDVPPEPVEVRRGILDDVEDMVRAAGRSRRVFPYNRLRIQVLTADAGARAAMQAVLGGDEEVLAAVRERLAEIGCAVPEGLEVRLQLARKRGAAWPPARAWHVAGERIEAAPAGRPAHAAPAEPLPQLLVTRGTAARRSVQLRGERVNIGRQAEVLDRDRRVVRRNQVVFDETDDAVNQTVSRAHAHIRISASGECRLFDDRSSYGTRIFRGGETIAVPPGASRGVRLRDGDEIYLGQACVKVAAKTGAR